MTTVRPEVVSLLTALDFNDTDQLEAAMRGEPATVRRQDGTALTADELALMKTATVAEFDAVVEWGARVREYHEQRAADLQRIVELTGPWYELNPAATLADVLPAMPPAERAEVQEILSRIAPDGQVFIEGAS